VRKGCFKLGLYWQGLTHDLSKYTWPEFRTGIKYYLDGQSPHNGERREIGYSTAWLHHKGRNRHHMEYWIDYTADPDLKDRHVAGMKMPVKYVVEMFVDRVSASKNYRGEQYKDSDPLEYYEKRKGYAVIHDDTRRLLEHLLKMLARRGEDATYAYIRHSVLHNDTGSRLRHMLRGKLRRKSRYIRT